MSVPCSSCGAALLWIRTPKGKAMPLDATPDPHGNIVIRDGLAVVLKLEEMEQDPSLGQRRFMPHWATCPYAVQHRKAKAKS